MSDNLMGRLKKTAVIFVMVTMRRLPEGELSSFGEEVDMEGLSESVQ